MLPPLSASPSVLVLGHASLGSAAGGLGTGSGLGLGMSKGRKGLQTPFRLGVMVSCVPGAPSTPLCLGTALSLFIIAGPPSSHSLTYSGHPVRTGQLIDYKVIMLRTS